MKSSVLLNPVLSGIASRYAAEQPSVGRALFPIFNTALRSANYYVLAASNSLNFPTDILHAPTASFKRSETVISNDNFYAQDYGIEELIADTDLAMYGGTFPAQQIATERAVRIVLWNHENRVKALATSGAVPSSSPSTKWDAANSTPIEDIQAAQEAIEDATGVKPDTLVLPRSVIRVLRNHSTITSKLVYTSSTGFVSNEQLAGVLNVGRIVEAGTQYNTANEGQTASIAELWGDSVILAVTNASQDLRAINFGRTFNWTAPEGSGPQGYGVFEYREDPRASVVVRARQFTDEKLTMPTAGYHLSNVLAV
jgi:hypothetical protein